MACAVVFSATSVWDLLRRTNMKNGAYPYSDWDQRPASHAPWQRGTELYEAYGRFLERMAKGTIQEDDGGWACQGGYEKQSVVEHRLKNGGVEDSGSYEANLGLLTEVEIEAHKLREMEKEKVAPSVDAAATIKNGKMQSDRAATIALQHLLRKVIPTVFADCKVRLKRVEIELFLADKQLSVSKGVLTVALSWLRLNGVLVFTPILRKGCGRNRGKYGLWSLAPTKE